MVPRYRSTLFLIVLTAVPSAVSAQGFAGWIGLHRAEQVGWLENENRIGQLCGGADDFDACFSEMMGPAPTVVPLYVEPELSSARIGYLIVIAVPGRGLSAHFLATEADAATLVTPDLFLRDWGYGPPYFHQTFTRRVGTWFQLPPGPWEAPVWIDRASDAGPSILEVHAGDIIELQGRGMYVVSADRDELSLRPEQPADMWCREGEPPPLAPHQPTVYSRAELLDDAGHLMIRPKYMKGC